jgi:hypothetical protein
MTLATHALVGAAVASFFPEQPAVALCAAFASHFLVDAIPHGDYRILSASIHPEIGAAMTFDRTLALDMLRIGADALIGIALAFLFFAPLGHPYLVLLAACAGILPDPLQFAYTRFKREPLVSLQRFHQWIHTAHRMHGRPVLAVVSQFAFAAAVVFGTLGLLG